MARMVHPSMQECDFGLLRALLVDAMAEADKCDCVVAAYVATALGVLDQRFGPDQSKAR